MSSNFVNLSETGGLTRAGRGYGDDADAGQKESRNFQSRMDASQAGLRGRAGAQFTGLTTQHSGNLVLLGRQFAEQALRAVRGEAVIHNADNEAHTTQTAPTSTVDSQSSSFARQINF